jgi:hypothetical protein
MTADEILAAREAGHLDDLLAGKDPVGPSDTHLAPVADTRPQSLEEPPRTLEEPPQPLEEPQPGVEVVSREQLRTMSAAEIMSAYEDGRLDRLKQSDGSTADEHA